MGATADVVVVGAGHRRVPRALCSELRGAGAEGVAVTLLQPQSDGGFVLETSTGPIAAELVVLSTGAYQRPHRPAGANTLPADILQIDVEDYRNPAELPPGAVLVVG